MTQPDGGSPFDEPEITEDTAGPVERLRSYEDGSREAVAAEFAGLLADRITTTESLVPTGYVMASYLLLQDLRRGIDGFSGEPMESSLSGISETQEGVMQKMVSDLARTAFSEGFAEQVDEQMRKLGLLPPAESDAGELLEENEIITEPITTIDEAHEKIIGDARERVADLDWEHFGVNTGEAYKIFEATYPVCLSLAPCVMPLNVLTDKPGKHRGLLLELPEDHKRQLDTKFWMAMPSGKIPPEYATFVRDYLFLKVSDTIAMLNDLDVPETMMYLAEDGGDPQKNPLGRAATRTRAFLEQHPELMKKG